MLTDREQDDSYRRAGGLGMEGSSKKEKGLMDMDNSVVIEGWHVQGGQIVMEKIQ